MKDELTAKMHSEFTVTKESEEQLKAGCIWLAWCDKDSSKEEVEKYAKQYSISYEAAMKWRDFWLEKRYKSKKWNEYWKKKKSKGIIEATVV